MSGGRCNTHIDEREFWDRFGTVEHEALEFRVSARRLRNVIPAMAMTAGGRIVLGVTDDRELAGCPLDQTTLDTITQRARDAEVDVDVEQLVVAGVPLTVVTVPRVTDRIVTTSDGRLLRRVGGTSVPLRGDALVRFVRRRRLRRVPLLRGL